MTFNDVEDQRTVERSIRRIIREIRELERTPLPSRVRSIKVNGEWIYTSGSGSSLPSSPVEAHLHKIQQLEQRKQELEKKKKEFQKATAAIPDEEIRSIIYWRTDQLRTWEQISMIVMRSGSESTSRSRLRRYLESCPNFPNNSQ